MSTVYIEGLHEFQCGKTNPIKEMRRERGTFGQELRITPTLLCNNSDL